MEKLCLKKKPENYLFLNLEENYGVLVLHILLKKTISFSDLKNPNLKH